MWWRGGGLSRLRYLGRHRTVVDGRLQRALGAVTAKVMATVIVHARPQGVRACGVRGVGVVMRRLHVTHRTAIAVVGYHNFGTRLDSAKHGRTQ